MSERERVFRKFNGHHYELRFPPGVTSARAFYRKPDGTLGEGCIWSLSEMNSETCEYYEDTSEPDPDELTTLRTFYAAITAANRDCNTFSMLSAAISRAKDVVRLSKEAVT